MAITPYSGTFPDRLSAGDNEAYAEDVYNYLAYIDGTFVTTVNSTETNINNKEASAVLAAETATAAASTATTKANLSADYAEKMALEVEAGTYSSKEHAIGDLTASGGSAKAWAIDASSPDGTTTKSSKTWALEAADSATAAAAAVASIPAGSINDTITTLVDTWSSSKINTELGNKQDTLVSGTNIKTVNSVSILGSGNLVITDDAKLPLSGGNLTGAVNNTQVDKGTVSSGTVTFTQSAGNVQRLQVSGALTIAVSGWATTGIFSDILLRLVNAGSATVTLPTINWIKPDGTLTTTFATYLTAIARPALQTSGVDFMYLFTLDGGTTLYGKLL